MTLIRLWDQDFNQVEEPTDAHYVTAEPDPQHDTPNWRNRKLFVCHSDTLRAATTSANTYTKTPTDT